MLHILFPCLLGSLVALTPFPSPTTLTALTLTLTLQPLASPKSSNQGELRDYA